MSFKLFPSSQERIVCIAIIFFCAGMVVGLLPGLDIKTIAGSVATLIAAFAGAYFAYKFNADREGQRKKEIDLASANRAIFTLIRAHNHVARFNKQFIQPHKDSQCSYVTIRPLLGNLNPDLKLDYDSISFLIVERKVEILTELTEFEELLTTLIEVVKKRNEIYLDTVEPAMEQAGFVHGGSVTLDKIDKVLGDRTSHTMKSLTLDLIDTVQCGQDKSEQLIIKLHGIMVEIFPGENVIKMKNIHRVE